MTVVRTNCTYLMLERTTEFQETESCWCQSESRQRTGEMLKGLTRTCIIKSVFPERWAASLREWHGWREWHFRAEPQKLEGSTLGLTQGEKHSCWRKLEAAFVMEVSPLTEC